MRPSLMPDLPDPEWLQLLRAEQQKGKTVSQIARETGIARSSLSMLLSGTYPAQSLDLVARKHAVRVVQTYRNEVLCPHLRRGIGIDACKTFAGAPMSTANPEKLRHWAACKACPINPLTPRGAA